MSSRGWQAQYTSRDGLATATYPRVYRWRWYAGLATPRTRVDPYTGPGRRSLVPGAEIVLHHLAVAADLGSGAVQDSTE